MSGKIEETVEELLEGSEDSNALLALVNQQNFRKVSDQLVKCFLDSGYSGILLTSHRTHRDVLESLEGKNIDISELYILDVIGEMVGQGADKPQIKTVNSPEAFNDINTEIHDFYDEIEQDRNFLLLDSFTSLLIHNSVKKTGRFVEKLVERVKKENSILVVLAVREQLEKDTVEKLERILDKTVEFL